VGDGQLGCATSVMPAAGPAAGGARAASSSQGASTEWDAGQSPSDEEKLTYKIYS